MSDTPLRSRVLAVIVNYNTGALLREAVDSLLASSPRPEIEIVDNASKDDSLEFLEKVAEYKGLVCITTNQENCGFARAVNQILNRRSAEYYLIMNPDCVLDHAAVREFMTFMDDNPGVGLAGGKLTNSDGTTQKTSKRRIPNPWSALARTLGLHRFNIGGETISDFDLAKEDADKDTPEEVEAVSGALMFVRASALPTVGLLDEDYFMHCEDLDWCKRFNEAGLKIAYVPSATAVHRKGGSGRGPKVIWHLYRGMSRFYKKHYRSRYPAVLFVAVQAGIYLRCAILVVVSLIRRVR